METKQMDAHQDAKLKGTKTYTHTNGQNEPN